MRYEKINPVFYTTNRTKLKKRLQADSVAIIYGNYQMPRNGDQYFPYRQDSDFFYLTGIEQEKSILLLAPNAAKEFQEVLFIIKSNPLLETWEGHKLTPEEAADISGISTIKFIDDFDLTIRPIIVSSQNLYFNPKENPKFASEVKSKDEIYQLEFIKKFPSHQYQRLAPIIQELRLLKSEPEIECIRKASSITHQAFLNLLNKVKPGMREYEIEAIITYEFIRSGATGHAYQSIVASGENACFLHYIENSSICKNGELILLDFGAEYANYAADLSRTIPVNGKFTTRQREMYQSCYKVFQFAKSIIRPGITINDFHTEVCDFWQEEHIRLGLYTAEEVKNNTGEHPLWYNYYMHGTSHFLGLDVHDPGTRDIVLKTGMVLTCEPAIYCSAEKTGIRLENDLLITDTGNIDLMEAIPMDPDEIENLMNTR